MSHFRYDSGEAFAESVPLKSIAQDVGTPVYVYSSSAIRENCVRMKNAFSSYPTLICFAVKANSNISVLKEIFSHGFGADVVSVGELGRALAAGVKNNEIVYSGVGKTRMEISRSLRIGILSFNVESLYELELISQLSDEYRKNVDICLRVNPNIDAETLPQISTGLFQSKFGIPEPELENPLKIISKNPRIRLIGIGCHIGSQITELKPFQEAADRMALLAENIKSLGFGLEFIDLGGGLGISYQDERIPQVENYAESLIQRIAPTGLKLIIEPGRSLVGNAGVLVTEVIGFKKNPAKNFIVVDAAMNDLIRPALYGAFHEILPVKKSPSKSDWNVDIVGPVCETGDFLGQDRDFTFVENGDLLYIKACGAYVASMASNYNTRPRAAEVMVDGNNFHVVRPREKLEALWKSELECLPLK